MTKKSLILLFFSTIFLPSSLLSQEISGRVLNIEGDPLIGASVYFDGTTIGDVTDAKGSFSFEVKAEINAILIVSYVGYKTRYLESPSTGKPYLFKLEEDVSVMGEVVVFNNPFSRKQLLKAFKEQFIGNKRLQKKCIIKNEEDIRFKYDPKSLTFSAISDKALEIENYYLGYDITYNLIKFEVQYRDFSLMETLIKSSVFSGTTQFKSMKSTEEIEERRHEAYQNSSLSFFRALKTGRLEQNGFHLYYKGYRTSEDSLMDFQLVGPLMEVTVKQQKRGFNPKEYVGGFDILYKGKKRSSISFYTTDFRIDAYGLYSNFDKILFSGAISEKKMAMILPADYSL
ncbi:CarboxypepD_reg-like domain-containing protein [Marivirga sericea]|uniref:CarboxypepD_reg-like domain-containing protein n=1 Tax=Marivirga sericea TaxID=1028 RepID=A0A1X7KQ84_9BACT|nr:carboxypeptidase-like regulatory domain-containing protein [Marivirga sericea]SMG43553.1 CarboxypepD_reg-like domain-containing protein [Marivirga sericea]